MLIQQCNYPGSRLPIALASDGGESPSGESELEQVSELQYL